MTLIRKRILVSAAGTATANHLVRIIHRQFGERISVFACDTNPRHLVACGKFCDGFYQVPPVAEPQFPDAILSIIKKTNCDMYIPLIDRDLDLFPGDSIDLAALNCRSTAPPRALTSKVTDKAQCFAWLREKGLLVPEIVAPDKIDADCLYFVKPRHGFGSQGTRTMTGADIQQRGVGDELVQELCHPPEITVEVYRHKSVIKSLCRERIETKQGVCTKARVFADDTLHQLVLRTIAGEEWPVASCLQVMRNGYGDWVITDVNLRIGAGSALSSAAGWDLASAALATWLDLVDEPEQFLQFEGRERHVVREYAEIVTD